MIEFGFLLDNHQFDFDNFEIKPNDDHGMIVENFFATAHVSDGWMYPDLEYKKPNMHEKRRFKCSCFQAEPIFFTVSPTHTITGCPCDPNKAKFLVLSYGFLLGLYLSPVDYLCINRLAYDSGKLTGVVPKKTDCTKGMLQFSTFYDNSNDEIRKQMFAIMHWFLTGQSYRYAWDRFDAQYKVLDGIFRLSNLPHCAHALRPLELARNYNLVVPSWAQQITHCGRKTSRIAVLRNELVHEAKFAGHPIGYAYPEENFHLEFAAFNVKLIACVIGLRTPYLKAAPDSRGYYQWNLE